MSHRFKLIITAFSCLWGTTILATDDRRPNAELVSLFNSYFDESYKTNSCGENAFGFIEAAQKKMGAAKDLYFVRVENIGISNIEGMLQAEAAGGMGSVVKGMRPDANWFYHAFVLDKSGFVYDFNYEEDLVVLPLDQYLENMWLNDDECKFPERKRDRYQQVCIPREERLKSYQFSVIAGEATLGSQNPPMAKYSLEKFQSIFSQH